MHALLQLNTINYILTVKPQAEDGGVPADCGCTPHY